MHQMDQHMNETAPTGDRAACASTPASERTTRLLVDAPVRVFHGLFALSFTGAWLTAESERWQEVHVSLGHALGGLLLFRLAYGLFGPRQARLSLLSHRAAGFGRWLQSARAGRPDLTRLATHGMGLAILLSMAVAAPLVLSGVASDAAWLARDELWEEVHECFANAALALVLAHLALIVVLSLLRRKNLVKPMITGRTDGSGPDVAKAQRGWLALALVLAYVTFLGWQLVQPLDAERPAEPTFEAAWEGGPGAAAGHDDEDEDDD